MSSVLSTQVLPRRRVLARSALATVEIMTVLIAAHTWAGGALPTLGWMLGAAGLVCAVGTVALRGRVPLSLLAPALVVAQLLLHCWLVVLAPPAGHAHGGHLDLTWQMVLAHVAGGLVAALVWELRRRAVEVLLTWSEVGRLAAPTWRRPLARYAPVLPPRHPLVVLRLRGPPVGLA